MDIGQIILGGVVGSLVPVLLGLLGFARFTGKIEERVDGLRRDFDKFEKRLDHLDQSLGLLTERIAKLEASHGL